MDHPSSSKRKFEECWEELYLLTQQNGEIQCLVCHKVLPSERLFNLKRHYNTCHAKEYGNLSRDDRLQSIERLKGNLIEEKENQSEDESSVVNKHAVIKCSYELALKIARNGRPFSDGEFIKDCLTTSVEILCPDQIEQFREVTLSRNTVTRRIQEMAADVQQQLAAATHEFIAYSLALDESTDVTGTPQIAIFVRGVNEKLSIIEELLDFSPLKETTTGADILSCVEKAVDGMGLDWTKLVSVTTDGAPAMIGEHTGFVGRLRNGLRYLPVPHTIDNFHCIIHQQNLCAKNIQFEDVMSVVIETTNYIRMNGLKRRQFRTFLEDLECDYGDLPLHTDVRWLSRGKVLNRFFQLRGELPIFLGMINHDVPQLQDKKWLCNLAFLCDLSDHLNILNVGLQGKGKTVIDFYDSIRGFRMKIDLWISHLRENNFCHFKKLTSVLTDEINIDVDRYRKAVESLKQDFTKRFQVLDKLEQSLDIVSSPFSINVETVPPNLQLELIDLKVDRALKKKFDETSHITEFYKNFPVCRFPNLHKCIANTLAMFGSTYICEQFFSVMKRVKSTTRTRITDSNLKSSLILTAFQAFSPDIEHLTQQKRH